MAHRVKNDATVDEVASLFRELHPHGNWRCSVHFRVDRVFLGSTLRIDLQVALAHVAADGPLGRTCAEGGIQRSF